MPSLLGNMESEAIKSADIACADVCAVLLCVYKGDDPLHFKSALDSVLDCQSDSLIIRVYLCIDGPLNSPLSAMVESVKDRVYRVVRNELNVGLAQSLNTLIEALSGERYVARMDADDICLPNRFKDQIGFMKENPHISVVGGAMIEVLSDGFEQIRIYPKGADECRAYLTKGSPLAHPTVMFRGELFSQGSRYPLVHQNEDIALWFQLVAMGHQIGNVQEPVLKFRLSEAALSRRGREKAFKEYAVYRDGLLKIGMSRRHLFFPLVRLAFRVLLPKGLIQVFYRSSVRQFFLRPHG